MSALSVRRSNFCGVPDAPPDPILSLTAMFREDPSAKKVNLGVGAYRTNESKPYILPVVHKVEKRLVRTTLPQPQPFSQAMSMREPPSRRC